MTWFMDPVPDGDSVHQVAQAYRDAHTTYSTHVQQTQTAHDATAAVWSGPGATAHSQAVATTQQHAENQNTALVALANVLFVVGTLLKLIFILQLVWLAIQVGTVIWGIFTAGLDALVTEGPAAAVAAVIQAIRTAAEQALAALAQAVGKLMLRAVIGGAAGGLTGLGVGIYTVESKHLSGWNAVLTIGGDTVGGAGAGAMIATNPIALAGTGVGLTQIGVQAAVGGPTDFELGTQQWVQQTLGGIPVAGGLLEDAVTPPTDLQSDFNTLVADTLVVGGVNDLFKDPEADAAAAKATAKPDSDYMAQSSNTPRDPGPRTQVGDDIANQVGAKGIRVNTSEEAQTWLKGDPNQYRGAANASLRIKADGSMDIAAYPDWSDGEMLEEGQHALRAVDRQQKGLPPNLNALPDGRVVRWMEETEVETQVVNAAAEGRIKLTPTEEANLDDNLRSYKADLARRRIVQAKDGDYVGRFVHINSKGEIDQVWNWDTYNFDEVYPPIPYHGDMP